MRVEFVKSYVKNILVHGPSHLDAMAKIFEGGRFLYKFILASEQE